MTFVTETAAIAKAIELSLHAKSAFTVRVVDGGEFGVVNGVCDPQETLSVWRSGRRCDGYTAPLVCVTTVDAEGFHVDNDDPEAVGSGVHVRWYKPTGEIDLTDETTYPNRDEAYGAAEKLCERYGCSMGEY